MQPIEKQYQLLISNLNECPESELPQAIDKVIKLMEQQFSSHEDLLDIVTQQCLNTIGY